MRDALRTAKSLVDENGPQEAWRIILEQALTEYQAGGPSALAKSMKVLTAFHLLTDGPGDEARQ